MNIYHSLHAFGNFLIKILQRVKWFFARSSKARGFGAGHASLATRGASDFVCSCCMW